MSDDIERMLSDKLADGKITEGDAEAVREFTDFLRHAGPPTVKGQPSPDGKSPLQRLIAAGRADLIEMALGEHDGEVAFWEQPDLDMENVHGRPPYNVVSVGVKILNTIDQRRMLDLGCGAGRLTNMMARRVIGEGVVHGVDISSNLVYSAAADASGRDLHNVHYWHGDGRRLPSGLVGRFSGAYSITMFQHIPHEAMWGYLREVHDRLEPGGVFLFTIAVGEVDEFLNHQIADVPQFANDLIQIYDSVAIDGPDERSWTWVTVRKEA